MYNYDRQQIFNIGGLITPVVKRILLLNIFVFFLDSILTMFFRVSLTRYFGLIPSKVISDFAFFQFFSYMFLHGGFFHIFWNMFILWMFGNDLEREWGSREFLFYYLLTGVGAGVLNFIAMFGSSIPTIGASGAIYGILVAFAIMFPNRLIYIYFLFPVKAKYFVLFIGVVTFFSAFSYSESNIAHFAHLGGMIFGLIYLKLGFKIFKFRNMFAGKKSKMTIHRKEDEPEEDLREEIDRILDKIQQQGYESLTEKERKTLKKASDHFKKS